MSRRERHSDEEIERLLELIAKKGFVSCPVRSWRFLSSLHAHVIQIRHGTRLIGVGAYAGTRDTLRRNYNGIELYADPESVAAAEALAGLDADADDASYDSYPARRWT